MASVMDDEAARMGGRDNVVAGLPRRRERGSRYTRVAIVLHWAIAALILFNLSIGYFMEGWAMPWRMFAVGAHISAGMTVLALTLLRIIWRLLHEPPPYPADMQRWERHTAHFVHLLLYTGMLLMPLTGWAILSAHPRPGSPGAAVDAIRHPRPAPPPAAKALPTTGRPGPSPMAGGIKIWGLVSVPAIAPIQKIGERPGGLDAQDELHEEFIQWHGIGGYIMIGLFLVHVAGALKHQFIDKQAELARMGIGRTRPDPE